MNLSYYTIHLGINSSHELHSTIPFGFCDIHVYFGFFLAQIKTSVARSEPKVQSPQENHFMIYMFYVVIEGWLWVQCLY